MTKKDLLSARNYINTDISREISLVEATDKNPKELKKLNIILGGGNFLSALGLMCYIEFAGKEILKKKTSSDNFNAFFDELGSYYKDFRLSFKKENHVYDFFRCGLAHEYFIKGSFSQIGMFGDIKYHGLGQLPDGQYYIVIKNLLEDFLITFDRLIQTLP